MSTKELLTKVQWLPVDKLINFHISLLVHNIIHTKEPEYLYLRIVNEQSMMSRSNIGRKLGNKPDKQGVSKLTKNQFCSQVYNIYNQNPAQITSITDKKQFKKHLKTYLFTNLLPNIDDFPIYGLIPGLQ